MKSGTPAHVDVVRALEENLWAMWAHFGRGRGCALHDEDGAVWFDTPIPTLPYNTVLRFTPRGDADALMDRIVEHYGRRGVPFMWIVHPTARPDDLPDRLRARGLDEAEVASGMWASLDELPEPEPAPEGIEIGEAVSAADQLATWEMVAWRWEVPDEVRSRLPDVMAAFHLGAPGNPVRCWIAWRGSVPIAKSVLNLTADSAGLYGVATRPEARGLGLARLLTLRAFSAARAAGLRNGVLHSSPMAKSLYEKLGFRDTAPFRIFTPPTRFHI